MMVLSLCGRSVNRNRENILENMKVKEAMEALAAGGIFCGSCGKKAKRLFGECDCGAYKPMLIPEGLLVIGREKRRK